jgi:hypothetical protein
VEVTVIIEEKDIVQNADLEELPNYGNQIGELDIELSTKLRAFMLRTFWYPIIKLILNQI